MIRIAVLASIASILAPFNACLEYSVSSLPGIANFPFGRTLHCELQNLVDAGFTNAEAIHAANLLLLNSNLIDDIANTFDIDALWAGGIHISISARKGQSCEPATFGV